MPEIPDLEAIRHYLGLRLEDREITSVEAPIPRPSASSGCRWEVPLRSMLPRTTSGFGP